MQKHSYYLTKHLARQNIHLFVYHPVSNEGKGKIDYKKYYTKTELACLTFVEIPQPNATKFPGHYIYDSYQYAKELYTYFSSDVDIIYIQGFSGWYLLRQLKEKNIRIPTIINFHGLEMFQRPASLQSILINAYFRPFVLQNLRLATYVQSLGGQLTNILLRQSIASEKIIEVGIGITKDWLIQECDLSQSSTALRKFVFVGRYERRKGIEELTRVLRELASNSSFTFDFIGPIPEHKQLLMECINYHGLVKDANVIKSILQQADVLVCPSYSEGMPTVILEAMASGCAIIATDVGAVSMQVDEQNGWLIPPADKAALKNAFIEAIQAPSSIMLEKQKVSLARIRKKFLWDQIAQQMMEKMVQIIKLRN